jgi:hypothetical protein
MTSQQSNMMTSNMMYGNMMTNIGGNMMTSNMMTSNMMNGNMMTNTGVDMMNTNSGYLTIEGYSCFEDLRGGGGHN